MQLLRAARDWLVGLTGVVLIIVGMTAQGVPAVTTYGTFGTWLGFGALILWLIAFVASQSSGITTAMDKMAQKSTIASIEADKELFGQIVMVAASSTDEHVKALITLVNNEFDRLKSLVSDNDPSDFEELSDQADQLFAYRALFASEAELDVMTYEALIELEEWGVPSATRAGYEAMISAAKNAAPPNDQARREWVMMLLRQHGGWDSYVSWFNKFLGRVTFLLVLLLFACLIEGVLQLVIGMTVLSLLFFGTAGAMVSILFSLPRVSSYEEVNAWIFHIVSRVITGIAGAYIGWGLISSKVVSFALGNTDMSTLLSACTNGCDAQHILIIGAIGMLMGFSERLLPDLESRFFNSAAKIPPPASTSQQTDSQPKGGAKPGTGGTNSFGTDVRVSSGVADGHTTK